MNLTGRKAAIFGGRTGLLGMALTQALERQTVQTLPLSRTDFDILDEQQVARFLDEHEPAIIFNTVAYTAVDKAEEEPEQAMRLNRSLPLMLARLARSRNIPVVHYSTDFVFDGSKDCPYTIHDRTNPTSVYGKTKLAGERALLELDDQNSLIIRTAWLFGPGKSNFVYKILQLARERDKLTVVHDQTGSPTYTPDLAKYSLDLVRSSASGIHHVVNSGRASWCELAFEAVNAAAVQCRVEPVPSSAYPTAAKRPGFSVLDTSAFTQKTGVTPRPWLHALRDYIFKDLAEEL